jgi:hypothetical protein
MVSTIDPITTALPSRRAARALPRDLVGVQLHDIAVPALKHRNLGILEDPRRGQLTACVRVEGGSFALAPTQEQEHRINRWGGLVANIARSNRHVAKVGFVSRTIPSDTNQQLEYFTEAASASTSDTVRRSYLELLQLYQRTADQREVLFFLTAHRPPSARHLPEAMEKLADAVVQVRSMFAQARMRVTHVLDRVDVALALRAGYDPWGRAARLEYAKNVRRSAPERVGDLLELAPSSVSDRWREVQADRGLHRTAWVSQWPSTEVGALFFLPLIVNPHVVRSVAWVAELRDPAAALRDINHQAIDVQSDQQAMARMGQRPTITKRQKWRGVAAREQELGRGHGGVRHAAFVTTSVFGDDPPALERAWSVTEQDAAQTGIRLEVLARRQAQALTLTLPMGRGIR